MPPADDARAAIRRDHRLPEAESLARLLPLQPQGEAARAIGSLATTLASRVRASPPAPLSAESFLRQYSLSTPEGIALMCVAEALLRIPDAATQDALLRDKLGVGDWASDAADTWVASAAEWGLMLTGKLAQWHEVPQAGLGSQLKHVVARLGEPVVRRAVRQAMRILAGQFVVAETIEQAAANAALNRPYRFSFDMLGEAARSAEDADRYLKAYARSIRAVGAPDSVSIKLSALHPRFEEAKRQRVFEELLPRVAHLASSSNEIFLTIDAEESERLELTLDLYDFLTRDFTIGLAVQAYQRRALAVCDWIVALGRRRGRRLPIRLVKGAY